MAVTRAAARKRTTPNKATPKATKATPKATKATPRTKAVNAANARAKAAVTNAAKAKADAARVKENAHKTVAKAKANVAKARENANRAKANAVKAIADAKAKAIAGAKAYAAKTISNARAKIFTNTKSIQKAYDNTYTKAKAEAKAKGYPNVEDYADTRAKAAAAKVTKIIASSSTVGQKLSMLERLVRSKAMKYGVGSTVAASAASYMSPEVGKFMFRAITSAGLGTAYVMRILKRVLDAQMIKLYRPKIEELMRREAALRRKKMLASTWTVAKAGTSRIMQTAGVIAGATMRAGGYVAAPVARAGGYAAAPVARAIWNVITSVTIPVPEKLKFVQIFFGTDVPRYIKDIIASVQREGKRFVGKSADLVKIVNLLKGAKVTMANWVYEVSGWVYRGYVASKPGAIEVLKGFFGGTLPTFLREMVHGKPPPPAERSTIVRQIADRLQKVMEAAGESGGKAWAGVKTGANAWAKTAEANPKLVEHILLGAGGLVAIGLATYLITETTKAVYSQQPSNDRRRGRRHRRR